MSNLPYLFALAVVLAAMLASVAIWAPRGLAVKLAALACAATFMPVAYAGYSDLLSRPKPVSLEWWQGQAKEATILGSQMREGRSLYVWLQLPGTTEPRAYELPWNQQMAQQLQQANEALSEALRVQRELEASGCPSQWRDHRGQDVSQVAGLQRRRSGVHRSLLVEREGRSEPARLTLRSRRTTSARIASRLS